MTRLGLFVATLTLSVGCLGGSSDRSAEATRTAADALGGNSTREPTASATATPTATAEAEPDERLLVGRNFQAVTAGHWLLVDPDRPLEMERLDVLPARVLDEVEQVRRDATTEIILTGLPREAESQIRVTGICDPAWSHGAGDWARFMDLTIRQTADVGLSGAIAMIEGLPYPVLEVSAANGSFYDVNPVSRDGCTYGFSLDANSATTLDEFLDFLEVVELGLDGGQTLLDDPMVPAGWTRFGGRRFSAALPTNWMYNDPTLPLTDEQRAVLAELDGDVASVIEADEGVEGIEYIYTGLPIEPYTGLSVLSSCDEPGSRTAAEWVSEAIDQRERAGTEVLSSGLTVMVDGRPHDVYLAQSADDAQFEVYPLDPEGCGYAFVAGPQVDGPWLLIDFMMFMSTVELGTPAIVGGSTIEGRHFDGQLLPGWLYFDSARALTAEEEATLADLPPTVADAIRADLDYLEESQFIYTLLPVTETRVLVFTFCGFSNFTAADWEALNASDYGEQGLEMLPLGRRVAVDQGTYEVWEVVTGEEVEWLVLPLSGGCLYAFSLYAQMSDGELLDEFVSFLGTVTLTGE